MLEEQLDQTFVAVAFSVVALGLLVLLYAVPHTIGVWRLFRRAKKPGWAAVVPVYNTYVQGQIAKKPGLALAVNGLLVALVVLALITPMVSTDVQALLIVSGLLFVVLLFMAFEELDKHFLKHFGLSKHSLEGSSTGLLSASKRKSKK